MQRVWWVIGVSLIGLCLGWLIDSLVAKLVGIAGGKWGRWLPGPLLALALALLFLTNGSQWLTLCQSVLVCLLLGVALCDYRSFTIPNVLVLAGILWALASVVTLPLMAGEGWIGVGRQLLSSLLSSLCIVLPVFILARIMEKRRGHASLGGGDIKLLFMLGLFFPLQLDILGVLLACMLGIPMALLPNKEPSRSDGVLARSIPFGVALSLSFFSVMLFGRVLPA